MIHFEQFGVDPVNFAIQMAIVLVVWMIPSIWAAWRVIRYRFGVSMIPWFLLIIYVPVLGAIYTLLFLRTNERSYLYHLKERKQSGIKSRA